MMLYCGMFTHRSINKCSKDIKTQSRSNMTQPKQNINEVNYNDKKPKKNKV